MKKLTKNRIIALFLLIFMICSSVMFTTVNKSYAGMSRSSIVTPDDIKNGEPSATYNVKGNVTFNDNKAIFGNTDLFYQDKLVAKAAIHNLYDYNISDMFQLKTTLDIAKIEDDSEKNSFSICFGVTKINADSGINDSVEIKFGHGKDGAGQDAITMAIYEYKKDGTETSGDLRYDVIKPERTVAQIQYNKPFVIDIDADSNRTFKIKLSEENGTLIKEYPEYRFTTDGKGFVGFYGRGNKKVTVYDTTIGGYRYETAQNVDIFETFSHDGKDCYNKNLIYTESKAGPTAPTGVSVKDGVLAFENATSAYLNTKYQYSNFELEMDVPYFQRRATYKEGFNPEGQPSTVISENVVKPISSWFGIAFGMSSMSENVDRTPRVSKYLLMHGIPYSVDHKRWEEYPDPTYQLHVSYDNFNNISTKTMHKNIANEPGTYLWDSKYDNDVSMTMKFSVIDGVVTLYTKLTEEADYGAPQFQFDLGYTPTGYIRIFACAAFTPAPKGLGYTMAANFSIDNLKITNLDAIKSWVPEPEFESNKRDKTPDYDYQTKPDSEDMNNIYKDIESENGGCTGTFDGSSLIVTLLLTAVCGIVLTMRRKDR